MIETPRQENNAVLPRFDSMDQLVEFFDTHDMGDYAAQMPEVQFEVAPKQDRKPGVPSRKSSSF